MASNFEVSVDKKSKGLGIQLSGLVSEPARMILLGLGLIGLAGFGKSRFKKFL